MKTIEENAITLQKNYEALAKAYQLLIDAVCSDSPLRLASHGCLDGASEYEKRITEAMALGHEYISKENRE